jgi:hypothetical protein
MYMAETAEVKMKMIHADDGEDYLIFDVPSLVNPDKLAVRAGFKISESTMQVKLHNNAPVEVRRVEVLM